MPGITPDGLVASHGETVTWTYIAAAVYDSHGAFDEASSTVTTQSIKAIVSQPSERELRLSIQGQAMLHLTVPSTADVQAQRAGRPDRFTVRGDPYEVIEVRDDRHPFVGQPKRSVILSRLATPAGNLT